MTHGVIKTIRINDGDRIQIRKVRRTRSRKAVKRAYKEMKNEKPNPEAVSGGSMMAMLRALTSAEQNMK